MEMSYTLRICFGFFFILVKEFLCGSPGEHGKCWDEYRGEINENQHQENVLYVCTKSQLSIKTKTVYMDTARVPRFENSTCYCTVNFTNENRGDYNNVQLDYKIESFTDVLSVNAFGSDRFSTKDTTHVFGTTVKVNNVTFRFTYQKDDFKACLRIASKTYRGRESLFRVKCYANQNTPVDDLTSSSAKTNPTSTVSGVSTTETRHDSTSSLKDDTDSGSDNNSPSVAIIVGAAGGGAVLVIIIVIVIVVLVIKRKKPKNTKTNNEDYYMTENDLYNVRNSSIKSANEKTYDTYDEIEAAIETRESKVYAEVNKNRNKPYANTKQPHTVPENEYNHLNDFKGPVSTGNIYSSIGKRASESDANIYNSTNQETLGNASSGSRDDQIYDTSDEL